MATYHNLPTSFRYYIHVQPWFDQPASRANREPPLTAQVSVSTLTRKHNTLLVEQCKHTCKGKHTSCFDHTTCLVVRYTSVFITDCGLPLCRSLSDHAKEVVFLLQTMQVNPSNVNIHSLKKSWFVWRSTESSIHTKREFLSPLYFILMCRPFIQEDTGSWFCFWSRWRGSVSVQSRSVNKYYLCCLYLTLREKADKCMLFFHLGQCCSTESRGTGGWSLGDPA